MTTRMSQAAVARWLRVWDENVGPVVDMFIRERGLSRTEVMLLLVVDGLLRLRPEDDNDWRGGSE